MSTPPSAPLTRASAKLTPRYRGVYLMLNGPRFREAGIQNGWLNDHEWAMALGVEPTSIWRLRTGRHSPSARMIAALLDCLPDVPFTELFYLIRHPPGASPDGPADNP